MRPSTMDYDYERFITTIQQKAELSWSEAERAAEATLGTLAERLSAGQARDIAKQLPDGVSEWIWSDTGAQAFGVDDFLRRIAEREGVDVDMAERHARAVFVALGRFVKPQELADMAAELPKDFEPLVAAAQAEAVRQPEDVVLSLEQFVRSVADRAGIQEDAARRAAEAVLETLGERLAGGEVEDLAAQLPKELRPAIMRGLARIARATKMSLEELLDRVVELEGGDISPEDAQEHARAVLLTLRDTVSEKEWADMVAELPDEYRPILS